MENSRNKCTCSPTLSKNAKLLLKNIVNVSNSNKLGSNVNKNKSAKIFNPWQRLYDNQTNSFKMKTALRKITRYQAYDELDFVLAAAFQPTLETFADKCDVYLQPRTLETKKYISGQDNNEARTVKKVTWKKTTRPFDAESVTHIDRPENMHKEIFKDHPLIIGGITNRIHPSSIKLMNTSQHSPQTNAGYVRQDRDGNLFQY